MDYKKKYEEALERARKVHTTNVDENKKSTEYIFPDLKESEDEKIRKDILSFAENMLKNNISKAQKDKFKFWISWLEKQGEKPQGKSALEAVKEEPIDNDIKAEIKVEEPKTKPTFKPYGKVLVCKGEGTYWFATFFSCYNPNDTEYYYRAINGNTYSHCLPYEGNEHLNGVKFKPEHIEGYEWGE